MTKLKQNSTFGGIYFVDALASSVGIILLILFILLSLGLDQYTPRKLSKMLEENIVEGNMPIETGYLVKGGEGRKITDRCFCYTPNPLKCPLVKVFNDHIELVWDGIVINKDDFFAKQQLIADYVARHPVYPQRYHGLYFLIYENGMYHFLNDFNREEIEGYWNKEWLTEDLRATVDANTNSDPSTRSSKEDLTVGANGLPTNNADNVEQDGRPYAGSGNSTEEKPGKENNQGSIQITGGDTPPDESKTNDSETASTSITNSSSATSDTSTKDDEFSKPEDNSNAQPIPNISSSENEEDNVEDSKDEFDIVPFFYQGKVEEKEEEEELTEAQKKLMALPELDSLIQVYAEKINETASNVASNSNQNGEVKSIEELKRELVQSGNINALLTALSNEETDNVEQEMTTYINEKTIAENATTLDDKKVFTPEEFKEKIEPVINQYRQNKQEREQQNPASSKSQNKQQQGTESQDASNIIIIEDSMKVMEYDPITQLHIPTKDGFDESPDYIFWLDRPIDIVYIQTLEGVQFTSLTQDTSLRVIMAFHTEQLPYSSAINVITRAGSRLSLDSLNYEKYDVPNLTYSWIPVKYKDPGGDDIFKDESEMFVYGMVIGSIIYLPADKNGIIFTNFEQEIPPSEPPNFMWTRILAAVILLIGILAILILRNRKLI
ncbi:MAG: hypothetical protein AAGA77_23010 [Bacteroidota bacterium]